jgi:hypothetical protein
MALRPHIIHVVGHTEAHHAASGEDVIESCKLARRAIENALAGQPDMCADPQVQARRAELVQQAQVTLVAIQRLADEKTARPLADPATLTRAVTMGILDAPQLRNNRFGRGEIRSRIMRGACLAVEPASQTRLDEERRLRMISITDRRSIS